MTADTYKNYVTMIQTFLTGLLNLLPDGELKTILVSALALIAKIATEDWAVNLALAIINGQPKSDIIRIIQQA